MKLALEKLSPITATDIFLNNFNVVARFTSILFVCLFATGVLTDSFPFEVQPWMMIPLPLIMGVSIYRLGPSVAAGFALRRLRYSGVLAMGIERKQEGAEWKSDLPKRVVQRKLWKENLEPLVKSSLEGVYAPLDSALILLGKDELGSYALKVYHTCKLSSCDAIIEKHFTAYDEERDGAVNWGGL